MKDVRRGRRAQEACRIAEILRGVNPRRIILFGSQATGRAGPESDIDLDGPLLGRTVSRGRILLHQRAFIASKQQRNR